jgi:hypothetical protein
MSRRKDVTDYTVDRFAIDQFVGARTDFLAWYDIARIPEVAAVHPLLVAQVGTTLDPREVEETLVWWREGLDELVIALSDTQALLDDGLVLNDERVEKLLSIVRHVENVSSHLLRNLEGSRYQDA